MGRKEGNLKERENWKSRDSLHIGNLNEVGYRRELSAIPKIKIGNPLTI